MSRTTTVGLPDTVPITRLSPAGTAAVQWTSDGAPPGVGEPAGDGADDATADGLAGAVAVPVGDALGELDAWDWGVGLLPHPQAMSSTARTASGRPAMVFSAT